MKWKVVYTSQARQDLDEMPLRFPLYEKEPWNSRGLRYFPENHFIIYYLPDEDVGTVNIVRIIYGGRDISKQLNEEVSYC